MIRVTQETDVLATRYRVAILAEADLYRPAPTTRLREAELGELAPQMRPKTGGLGTQHGIRTLAEHRDAVRLA